MISVITNTAAESLVPILFWWWLALVAKATVIAGVALILARVASSWSAAGRSVVLRLAVLGLLLLPVMAWIVPALAPGVVDHIDVSAPISRLTGQTAAAGSGTAAADNRTGVLLGLLLFMWLGGMFIVLGRVLAGAVRVRRVLAAATPAGPEIERRCSLLCSRTGLTKPIPVVHSYRVETGLVHGLFRPVIVLPASFLSGTSDALDMVLTHELAHIRRRDIPWLFLANLAAALYWFNPLIWRLRRRMLLEAEKACDDSVLRAGHAPARYAHYLLTAMRDINRSRFAIPRSVAMARRAQMEGRLMSIMSDHARVVQVKRSFVLAASALLLVGLLPLAGLQTGTTAAAGEKEKQADTKKEKLPGPDEFVTVEVMPELIKAAKPDYPEKAKQKNLEGTVYVQALVDDEGKVRKVKVKKSSGYKILDDAALKSAQSALYKPAIQDGKPVAVWVTYSITFDLDNEKDE